MTSKKSECCQSAKVLPRFKFNYAEKYLTNPTTKPPLTEKEFVQKTPKPQHLDTANTSEQRRKDVIPFKDFPRNSQTFPCLLQSIT